MFGLSVSKIILLALIVGAIVVGTRVLGRIGQEREAARRRDAERTPAAPPGEGAKGGPGDGSGEAPVDLVACRKCGTFFSPGEALDCGRGGCPYAA